MENTVSPGLFFCFLRRCRCPFFVAFAGMLRFFAEETCNSKTAFDIKRNGCMLYFVQADWLRFLTDKNAEGQLSARRIYNAAI